MNKDEILRELYINKNYSKLKKICAKKNDAWHSNILAKILFNEKKYKDAAKIYYKQKRFYEAGYCLLLQGDIFNAKRLWNSLDNSNPVIEWGKSLLGLIEKKPANPPTYFQIRNFLEQDLDALLHANLITYAENIINSVDSLAQVNSESYKYMARVLSNHHYFDVAKTFLEHSKNIHYKDPEIHFLLAKIQLRKGEKAAAKKSLGTAIDINKDYFPAQNLLSKINILSS